MPSQVITSVENNFTKGLVTEFTGMNFPENAATDCDNVEFTIVGDVLRRLGLNTETNGTTTLLSTSGVAINSYKWDNAGGDGSTQIIVVQVGTTLHFYSVTAATTASPLSTQKLASTITFDGYAVSSFDSTKTCEFADGNGYLFVFHPSCEPFYCSYSAGTITSASITIQVRDFTGIPESGVADDFRPPTLSASHNYNLFNQGWVPQPGWSGTSNTFNIIYPLIAFPQSLTWTIQTGLTISVSDSVNIVGTGDHIWGTFTATGTVTSYTSGTGSITISVTSCSPPNTSILRSSSWTITHPGTSYVSTFFTAASVYPSNAEQWWRYKNTSGVYSPSTTLNNITLSSAPAPKGRYIIPAFSQDRTTISGVSGLTVVSSTARPTNGCWFQGRIWYTGVNASQQATGTAPFTTWTENIYFSQIVEKVDDFGRCYQQNDPTSEILFDLLPTDGGVITIQGTGPIYKLFPIQNGLLVFAANGIWFITGSQGIGFAANDYTITKISNIQSISTSSYVNVMGLPYFWNEEGIYHVSPSQSGSLTVEAITVGTILSFYESIPLESKKNVRAAYHPIDYVIQWMYKSTNSVSTTDKFTFDKILNYNVYNKAFYPYTLDTTVGHIATINYVSGPGGSTTVQPSFKYFSVIGGNTTFADLHDTTYVDWGSTNYDSYFITGYKLHGQAQRRFQIPYLYMYSRNNGANQSYKIQSIWDYASSGNSGRWSTAQLAYIDSVYQTTTFKRHRLRGHGMVLQIKLTSVDGQPFDIIGWSVYEAQNMSV